MATSTSSSRTSRRLLSTAHWTSSSARFTPWVSSPTIWCTAKRCAPLKSGWCCYQLDHSHYRLTDAPGRRVHGRVPLAAGGQWERHPQADRHPHDPSGELGVRSPLLYRIRPLQQAQTDLPLLSLSLSGPSNRWALCRSMRLWARRNGLSLSEKDLRPRCLSSFWHCLTCAQPQFSSFGRRRYTEEIKGEPVPGLLTEEDVFRCAHISLLL